MKKVGNILLYIFAVGAILCLLAGALSLLGYLAALCIGGETATAMCVFIHKQYFPIVIRFTSVFSGIGLLGMYFNKISALSVKTTSSDDKDNKK